MAYHTTTQTHRALMRSGCDERRCDRLFVSKYIAASLSLSLCLSNNPTAHNVDRTHAKASTHGHSSKAKVSLRPPFTDSSGALRRVAHVREAYAVCVRGHYCNGFEETKKNVYAGISLLYARAPTSIMFDVVFFVRLGVLLRWLGR